MVHDKWRPDATVELGESLGDAKRFMFREVSPTFRC